MMKCRGTERRGLGGSRGVTKCGSKNNTKGEILMIKCPKCMNEKVVVRRTGIEPKKQRGGFGRLIWWVFVIITAGFALFASVLIKILINSLKPAERTIATCEECGHTWDILTCPKCMSDKIVVQHVEKVSTEYRGFIGWLKWLMLAICTVGIILIIPALTNSDTKSLGNAMGVCQNCGNTWNIPKPPRRLFEEFRGSR